MPRSTSSISGIETIKMLVGTVGLPEFTIYELAEHTGVSRRTVDTIRRRYEYLFEKLSPSKPDGPGRPTVRWRIRPDQVATVVKLVESRQSELQSALGSRWRASVAEPPDTELADSSLIMAADALTRPAADLSDLNHLVAAARHSLVAAGFNPDGTSWAEQHDPKLTSKARLLAAVADVVDASSANDDHRMEAAQERALLQIADAVRHLPVSEWLPLGQRIVSASREVNKLGLSNSGYGRREESISQNKIRPPRDIVERREAWNRASIEKLDILFEDLGNDKNAILGHYFPIEREVQKGEHIPVDGGLSYIEEGAVGVNITVSASRRKGTKSVRLADLSVGQFFGETAVLAPGLSPATDLVATKHCRLRTLRPPNGEDEHSQTDVFRKLIGNYPQLGVNLCVEFSRRLRRVNRMIPVHPRGRVALLLLEVANEEDPTTAILRLGHMPLRDIVDATGISVGAVRRTLREFEGEKTILREGEVITILDRNLLAREIAGLNRIPND